MLSLFRRCFKHIIEIRIFKLFHCIIEEKEISVWWFSCAEGAWHSWPRWGWGSQSVWAPRNPFLLIHQLQCDLWLPGAGEGGFLWSHECLRGRPFSSWYCLNASPSVNEVPSRYWSASYWPITSRDIMRALNISFLIPNRIIFSMQCGQMKALMLAMIIVCSAAILQTGFLVSKVVFSFNAALNILSKYLYRRIFYQIYSTENASKWNRTTEDKWSFLLI